MNITVTPKEALQHYREASQSWLSLRNEQSTAQLRLQALLQSVDKPSNYARQLETLREKLEILEWQISCAANGGLYAQRSVVDACVDNALSDFMENSGKALTSALAPYLNGPFGLDVAARVLRSALAHHAELNTPELLESCCEILDESGLSPDASMRMDASRRFTPAKHKTFQDRLKRLKLAEEAYGFTVS
ncbi:phage polarity suppression protein [Escherichia coli]|uniref:phage polarity suppression protein n=1 Tax=Escherichia coli TaxID=562 RepID=UPI00177727D1|nr:phage polarity suppression protein [Escherichia coli]WMP40916.1 bacterial effector [uncultured bacterium]HCF8537630.1 phage polarity suppression protein [Klebsiella pneumoniae]EFH4083195.1 phage polarity suppression protein [Escherichia coli]EFH4299398.1 phage polarity suppression protein [Escherichia coli]EFM2433282.1 phage polarity suppression protein [Escherichia coli]